MPGLDQREELPFLGFGSADRRRREQREREEEQALTREEKLRLLQRENDRASLLAGLGFTTGKAADLSEDVLRRMARAERNRLRAEGRSADALSGLRDEQAAGRLGDVSQLARPLGAPQIPGAGSEEARAELLRLGIDPDEPNTLNRIPQKLGALAAKIKAGNFTRADLEEANSLRLDYLTAAALIDAHNGIRERPGPVEQLAIVDEQELFGPAFDFTAPAEVSSTNPEVIADAQARGALGRGMAAFPPGSTGVGPMFGTPPLGIQGGPRERVETQFGPSNQLTFGGSTPLFTNVGTGGRFVQRGPGGDVPLSFPGPPAGAVAAGPLSPPPLPGSPQFMGPNAPAGVLQERREDAFDDPVTAGVRKFFKALGSPEAMIRGNLLAGGLPDLPGRAATAGPASGAPAAPAPPPSIGGQRRVQVIDIRTGQVVGDILESEVPALGPQFAAGAIVS